MYTVGVVVGAPVDSEIDHQAKQRTRHPPPYIYIYNRLLAFDIYIQGGRIPGRSCDPIRQDCS